MEIPNNKSFLDLLTIVENEDRIPWNEHPGVSGFSIVKAYSYKSKFKPAITKEGKPDSVVLIKVGFYHKNIDSEYKAPLFIFISKASKYLLDNHIIYNPDDTGSPTEESLKESEKSWQPVDLREDERFVLNVKSKLIFDTQTNKNIFLRELVDYIYNLHIDTTKLRGLIFLKTKIFFKETTIKLIIVILKCLWDILSLTGKKIGGKLWVDSTLEIDRDNFFLLFRQDKYTEKDLIPIVDNQKFKLLGSDYIISFHALLFISVILVIFFIIDYMALSHSKILFFFKNYSDNQLFLASMLVIIYFLIDRVMPRIVVCLINLFISFKSKVDYWKFRFS